MLSNLDGFCDQTMLVCEMWAKHSLSSHEAKLKVCKQAFIPCDPAVNCNGVCSKLRRFMNPVFSSFERPRGTDWTIIQYIHNYMYIRMPWLPIYLTACTTHSRFKSRYSSGDSGLRSSTSTSCNLVSWSGTMKERSLYHVDTWPRGDHKRALRNKKTVSPIIFYDIDLSVKLHGPQALC